MFARKGIVLAVCSALLVGCTEPPVARGPADEIQETIDNLVQIGYPAGDIAVEDGRVIVQGDGIVSLQASREMLQPDMRPGYVEAHDDHDGHAHEGPDHATQEQFRTNNLVGLNITKICINAPAFTGRFSDALNLAIQNWDEQPLHFSVARAPSSGCSFTIQAVFVPGGTQFFAEFGQNGLPGVRFTIGDALGAQTLDVMEHVMTHEIGHTLSFRHTDFFNRSISCGSGGAETGTSGNIHIPGTPTGAVVGGSLMNACFRTSETGEFTANDITAMRTLYTPLQNSWRWCHKCQGLFFGGSQSVSRCPAGGTHENVGSGNYHIANGLPASTNFQSNWRWCHKCQGIFVGGSQSVSRCPAGGTHENVGSGDYSFLNGVGAGSLLQDNWRWCSKCQGISFGANMAISRCPAGGTHNVAGSGNYSLFNR
jgi:hypothetical protein